jgi:hypothetical protein
MLTGLVTSSSGKWVKTSGKAPSGLRPLVGIKYMYERVCMVQYYRHRLRCGTELPRSRGVARDSTEAQCHSSSGKATSSAANLRSGPTTKTSEHFNTWRALSRRQARCLELLSQYDAAIYELWSKITPPRTASANPISVYLYCYLKMFKGTSSHGPAPSQLGGVAKKQRPALNYVFHTI